MSYPTKVEDSGQPSSRTRNPGFKRIIDCVHWTFNGNFQRARETLVIDSFPSLEEPFDIRSLQFYPIKYAEDGLQDIIRTRGEMFWKCRFRNYVCYSGPSSDSIQSNASYFPSLFLLKLYLIKYSRILDS
jgi:hypothetical protein